MRDHLPATIEKFRGWYKRDPIDSCPPDHFSDLNNVQITQKGVKTRPGLNTYLPFKNVLRIYTYVKTASESLLVLDTMGNIYDTGSPTPGTPILTINGMIDFAFVSINGRAFISPNDGTQGLSGESVYIYKGDGSLARKAGGTPPVNGGTPFAGAASATAGNIESGDHLYGVIYESDTGFLTSIGPVAAGVYGIVKVTSDGTKKVDLSHIPAPADTSLFPFYWIVATEAIQNFNGDLIGYQFFRIAGTRTATAGMSGNLTVNFFDAELLQDATHLLKIFNNIPAGVGLTVFHNRLVSWAEFGNTSVVRLSYTSEPETVDQVTGLLDSPLDSHPITNAQEFRDILYIYKNDKTFGYPDNNEEPAAWVMSKVDMGIGTSIHGIGSVLDTAGTNIEFLIQITFSGVYIFTGTYLKPELSKKIDAFWPTLNQNSYKSFQIMIDTIKKLIYINLLNSTILIGDYSNGLDPDNIKWQKYTFSIETDTIALVNENQLIIGSQQAS